MPFTTESVRRMYDLRRSRRFANEVAKLAVGEALITGISLNPSPETMHSIEEKLGIHLKKVRVPSVDRLVLVRSR